MKVLLGDKWNDFCLDTLCFFCLPKTFCVEFFNLSEVTEIFVVNWGKSFSLTLFLRCSLVFLSCATVSANLGAVFKLQNLSWLLLDTFCCWRFSLIGFKMWNRGWIFSYCVGWKAFKSKGFGRYYFFWV